MKQIKPRILVIDDEVDWAKSVKGLLQNQYDVDIIESGNEGIKRVRQVTYDLLLIDYQLLEEKKGTDIMVEIKQFNRFLPIILVSGKIDERKPIIEAIQKGVTNYLEKDPQLPRNLPVIIDNALRERDVIVQALEKWFVSLENPDQILVRTISGKEYSAKQILEEIRKDSDIGRKTREDIIRVALRLIEKGGTKI